MKEWFGKLEKREQNILLVGIIFVVFYLFYGVLYSGIAEDRDKYLKRNTADSETLAWMNDAVQNIKRMKGSSGRGSNLAGKSLSQLSELGAKRSGIRIGRFQPKDETEAQLWFDDVEFDQLLDFLARLETDYGLTIDDLSVNTGNESGIVNARLKFSK